MESSQTPPPGGSASPPPGSGPDPATAPPDAGPPPGAGGRAGAGPRIAALVLALVLAIVCAVGVAVMADVNDTPLCDEVPTAEQLAGGTYECYDFPGSIKPIVVGAGWIGAVLAGVAALLALAFTVRGRGGRTLLAVTIAAVFFLAISILAAQLS